MSASPSNPPNEGRHTVPFHAEDTSSPGAVGQLIQQICQLTTPSDTQATCNAPLLDEATLSSLTALARKLEPLQHPDKDAALEGLDACWLRYLTSSFGECTGDVPEPHSLDDVAAAEQRLVFAGNEARTYPRLNAVIDQVRESMDSAQAVKMDLSTASYVLLGLTALFVAVYTWLAFGEVTWSMNIDTARQTVYIGLQSAVNTAEKDTVKAAGFLEYAQTGESQTWDRFATGQETVSTLARDLEELAGWQNTTPEMYKAQRESSSFWSGVGRVDSILIALAGIALYLYASRVPGYVLNRRKSGMDKLTNYTQAGFAGFGAVFMGIVSFLLSIAAGVWAAAKTYTIIRRFSDGSTTREHDNTELMIALFVSVLCLAIIIWMFVTLVMIIAHTLWIVGLITLIRNKPEAFMAFAQKYLPRKQQSPAVA